MTASFIPLLAVQQRPHSRVYPAPVRELRSASEILQAGQAARDRLRGNMRTPKKLKPAVHVVPWPETPRTLAVEPVVAIEDAPLDMLGPCSWKFLVKLAALRHGQTFGDILGHSRTAVVIKARHEAMYLVARHTGYSIARIGHKFGRDHTTVLAALRKFPHFERERAEALFYLDPMFAELTTPERAAIIVRGYASGVPRQEIADQIGMSLATVKRFAYVHGLKHRTRSAGNCKVHNG